MVDTFSAGTGNIYKTREQAEHVIFLKKHIHEYPCPKKGERVHIYTHNSKWLGIDLSEDDMFTKMKYLSGAIMPSGAGAKEREKRAELIKKAYNG